MAEISFKNQEEKEYEEFVSKSKYAYFTQSIGWANVKSNWKREVVVSKDNQGNVKGAMLLLIRKVKMFKYTLVYSPRGPVCDIENTEVLSDLIKKAFEVCKKNNACQLKIDPAFLESDQKKIDILRSFGFEFTPNKADFTTVQLRGNYVINNLDGKSEEDLLMSFKQKTRYNIKVARKHDVKCVVGIFGETLTDKMVDDFYKLYIETGKRDQFVIRDKNYYKKILECMGQCARLFICYYNEEAVSASLCINYSNRTYYLFGASDSKHRNVMPNYLMQWEMMRLAIEKKSSTYDFMGIPSTENEDAVMAGVYQFKKGFCGETEIYAGEFDFNFNSVAVKMINVAVSGVSIVSKVKNKFYAKYN